MNSKTLASTTHTTPHRRLGAYLLILGALVAFCLTTYRYFAPLSGVYQAGGALLTLSSEALLVVSGLVAAWASSRLWRGLFLTLAWIIVILAFIAECFLHGWVSAAFLALAALGVVIQTFSGAPARSA